MVLDTTHCTICKTYFPDEPSEKALYSIWEVSCDPEDEGKQEEIMVLCQECWEKAKAVLKKEGC